MLRPYCYTVKVAILLESMLSLIQPCILSAAPTSSSLFSCRASLKQSRVLEIVVFVLSQKLNLTYAKFLDVIKHIGVMCAIKRYQRTRPTVETTAAVQPQHAARVHTPSPVRTPDLLPRSQHSPIAITPTYSQQKPTSKKQQQEIISVHPKTVDFGKHNGQRFRCQVEVFYDVQLISL